MDRCYSCGRAVTLGPSYADKLFCSGECARAYRTETGEPSGHSLKDLITWPVAAILAMVGTQAEKEALASGVDTGTAYHKRCEAIRQEIVRLQKLEAEEFLWAKAKRKKQIL